MSMSHNYASALYKSTASQFVSFQFNVYRKELLINSALYFNINFSAYGFC